MSNEHRDLESFARAVEALEPYLDSIVFIGGWAHYLHTLRPEASPLHFEPLHTMDADVAVPASLPRGEETIAELLRQAGFREHLSGDYTPPISEYVLGDTESGFLLEFLSPLVGSEIDREGQRRATTVVAGVTTQALRYLDILLDDPWKVTLGRANGFSLIRPLVASIPNPAAYIVQKMLVLTRRHPDNKPRTSSTFTIPSPSSQTRSLE